MSVGLLALPGLPRPARAQAAAKRVLIVHSFGRDFAPYDAVSAAFRRELASRSPQPVLFLEAALDAGRAIGPDEESAFVAYLRARFADPRPDLVVGIGPPSAQFLTRQRDALFPDVPLLLAGSDGRFVSRALLHRGDALVATAVDLPRLYEAMLYVLPQTQTIAVVLGSSAIERYWRKEAERAGAFLAGRVTFEWFDGLSLARMKERVAGLPPRSALLYGLLIVDGAGVPHERLDALAELQQAARVPIFSLFENEMGRGVLGGPYLSQSSAGREAAQAALRSLAGTSPGEPLVVTIGMSSPVYDWRELRRFGIPESRLPPGSEVRFRRPAPWVAYGREIAAASGLIVFQAALIATLLVQRKRRRRAELEARALGGRLISAHEDEGRRLARELHDDITQRLAGVAIEAAALGRLGDPAARAAAEQSISGELASLSRDVHALSYRLHPSVIDDLGLDEALRIECERAARRGQAEVAFHAEADAGALRGDPALCLFRVAQEALRNALRHAQAGTIRVELRPERGGTAVSVIDDGCGFDA
ncbi:MAG TPA: histidine kinase, partial [Burkholderiaceae bacterium]|nr:histidine kinase [Burkholderiaceae bacterium]